MRALQSSLLRIIRNQRVMAPKFPAACTLVVLFAFAGCRVEQPKSTLDEGWDSLNAPEIFNASKYDYNTLTRSEFLSGRTATQPWSDTYWPLKYGGIASRWIATEVFPQVPLLATHLDGRDPQFDRIASDLYNRSGAEIVSHWGQAYSQTIGVSVAEKVDIALGRANFNLAASELTDFIRNTKTFAGTSWSWMGHCHGWAPASILYAPPQQGVLMTGYQGQQVFFTPGDIRGVLTKAAADQEFSTRQQFLGTRCDDARNQIPRDSMGRMIDGAIGIDANGDGVFEGSLALKILGNNWAGHTELGRSQRSLTFQFLNAQNSGRVFLLEATTPQLDQKRMAPIRIYSTIVSSVSGTQNVPYQIIYSSNFSETGIYVDALGQPLLVNGAIAQDYNRAVLEWQNAAVGAPSNFFSAGVVLKFKSWKECRDLNPGTFHLVLASLLSPGGNGNRPAHGFVMDITRDDQVWNHPIYSFASRVGLPTPLFVDGVQDPYIAMRAPGTAAIVDVYTDVVYGVENGPKITYQPADEALEQKTFHYTLELSSDGRVIGGEWHLRSSVDGGMPLSGPDLLKRLATLAGEERSVMAEAPDFIWSYPLGSKIRDGGKFPSVFIEKLHACSLKGQIVGNEIINGQSIPFAICDMRY